MAEEMQNENELDLTLDSAEEENTQAAEAVNEDSAADETAGVISEASETPAHQNAHWYVVHTYSGYEMKGVS